MRVHTLKTDSRWWFDLAAGTKTFECRKDDKEPPYEIGDILILDRLGIDGKTTGDLLSTVIIGKMRDFEFPGITEGYCILSLGRIFNHVKNSYC